MKLCVEEIRQLLAEGEGAPLGATRLRKGAWWKKVASNKWKLLNHVRQHGIEVAKHQPTQPVPQPWQRKERFNT